MKMKCECSSCIDPEKKAKVWKTAESVDDVLSNVLDSYLKSQAIDNEGAIDTATVNGTIYGMIGFVARTLYQIFTQQEDMNEQEFMELVEIKFKDAFKMNKTMNNSISPNKKQLN